MTEMDNDPFFRQLEIVAGIESPLTWDTREAVLRMAVSGIDFDGSISNSVKLEYTQLQRSILTLVTEENLKAVAYLAELFFDEQIAPDDSAALRKARDRVYSELRICRANYLGLPVTAKLADVLSEELKKPDHPVSHLSPRHLTMAELRRARDVRRGTYVPLVNNGEW